MRFFPAFFDLKGRRVVVVGDGALAARKIRLLLKADPKIEVYGAGPESAVAGEFGTRLSFFHRPVAAADLEPRPALMVVATEDAAEQTRAAGLGRAAGVAVNTVDRPELCDVVVPSMIERGDVAIGISTGGAAPVIGRRLRERMESLLPARLGDLVSFSKGKREEVAHKVAPDARRGFWERLFEGPMAEAVLDGDMPAAERHFAAAIEAPNRLEGRVHIVGAGPGDPELLTLKALRVLQEADIVLYDNLVSDGVLELIRRDAERVYVGKRKAAHSVPQQEIAERMIALAKAGKRVVRLKGGDPFIFGRGGEESDAVRAAGLSVTIVPGITAATGSAAAMNVPLTQRGESQAVTFVTAYGKNGTDPAVDWRALARLGQTIVVYMGLSRAHAVAADLISGGASATLPVAIVENGTLRDQRVIRTDLSRLGADAADAGLSGPTLLIIGDVAARAEDTAFTSLLREGALAA